jgi:hypothetical protein
MQIVKIDLKDGQWARAHSRPSHGQMKQFFKTFRGKSEDEAMESQADLILLLCVEWEVKGEDGALLPLTPEGVDETPQDIVTELTEKLGEYVTLASGGGAEGN